MAHGASSRGESRRLAGIEGMRAIAASSIVVYHVWLYGMASRHAVDFGAVSKLFANLRAGVTLFFVLSGFLLFRPYVAAALRARPGPSLGHYLRNRALRILPAYWVILIAVAVLIERDLLRRPGQLTANLALAQNYVPEYIHGLGIVPAWSLAIEVTFYLVLPLLGALAIRLASGRDGAAAAAFAPVVLMTALGIGSKVLGAAFLSGEALRVWNLTLFTHADWFAAGMALAVLRVLWEDGRLTLPRRWRPATVALAFLVALAGAGLYEAGTLSALENQTLMALACALVLALVVFAEPGSLFLRLLECRAVFAAGLASYSLFLWHDPLLRGIRDAGLTLSGRSGFVVNLLFLAVLSGVASFLTYRFVERPALARKRTWQHAAAPPPGPELGELQLAQASSGPGVPVRSRPGTTPPPGNAPPRHRVSSLPSESRASAVPSVGVAQEARD